MSVSSRRQRLCLPGLSLFLVPDGLGAQKVWNKRVLLTDPSVVPLSPTVRYRDCPWSHLPPKVSTSLSLKTCGYVTSCAKKHFANVITSGVLETGR